MTLTTELNRVEYSPSGSDTSFDITFVFWDDDDALLTLLNVDGTETIWVRGTQYTVTGGSGAVGNAAVVTSPTDYTPASGTTLVITSNLPDKQETDLTIGGAFPSSDVEQQLDKIVRMIQQHDEENDRSLHFPVTDAASLSSEIPNSSDRASAFLAFNSSGVPIASTGPTGDSSIPVSTFMETMLDDSSKAEARTTIAAEPSANTVIGLHTLWVPAKDFDPTVSNGCASIAVAETTAGRADMKYLAFDGLGANEHAQASIIFPKSREIGVTISFRIHWTGAAGSGTVEWTVKVLLYDNSASFDVAFPVEVTATDTLSTAEDHHSITTGSFNLTQAAGGDSSGTQMAIIEISRDSGSDSNQSDAHFLGLQIYYTVDSGEDT